MSDGPVTLLLLRHAEVASHRGDVPVTEQGRLHAVQSGKAIAAAFDDPTAVLFGGTRRTRETAESLIEGMGDPGRVSGPRDAFALRNPDMYVGGVRVDMVSSAASLAEQVPGLSEQDAAAHPWFAQFFAAADRIGWWLEQDDPPGENAASLMRRIEIFARSVADPGPFAGCLILAVTHSPLLRATLRFATAADPGEPGYVTGARLTVTRQGIQDIQPYDPLRH
jgi:broad specificity phosphatase PhoE